MSKPTPEPLDEEQHIPVPWHGLSKQPPYVLKQDQVAVKRFNRGKPASERFNLNLVPEPFWGSLIGARVILLNDHPLPYRRMTQDPKLAKFEKILKEGCLDVLHRPCSAYLQSDYDKRSSAKWLKLLDPLIQQCGLQKVIDQVGCINWWPYRIERLDGEGPVLPSHDFTRQMVKNLLGLKRKFVALEHPDTWVKRIQAHEIGSNIHQFDEDGINIAGYILNAN
jgi:hypothetical protein